MKFTKGKRKVYIGSWESTIGSLLIGFKEKFVFLGFCCITLINDYYQVDMKFKTLYETICRLVMKSGRTTEGFQKR